MDIVKIAIRLRRLWHSKVREDENKKPNSLSQLIYRQQEHLDQWHTINKVLKVTINSQEDTSISQRHSSELEYPKGVSFLI